MRRANKILMATVAILLCLVLITTSVVSGVFAKYAIKKQASTSVGIEKFGVKVELNYDPNFVAAIGGEDALKNATASTGDSIAVTINRLNIVPGTSFREAIKVKITGDPTVKVKISIFPDATWNDTQFLVDAGVGGLETPTKVVPIGFTMSGYDKDGVCTIPSSYIANPGLASGTEKTSATGISNKVDMTLTTSTDPDSVYKIFDPQDSATKQIVFYSDADGAAVNEFALGFEWPFELIGHSKYSVEEFDEISTWLAANKADKAYFTMNYIVKIEQV